MVDEYGRKYRPSFRQVKRGESRVKKLRQKYPGIKISPQMVGKLQNPYFRINDKKNIEEILRKSNRLKRKSKK